MSPAFTPNLKVSNAWPKPISKLEVMYAYPDAVATPCGTTQMSTLVAVVVAEVKVFEAITDARYDVVTLYKT